MVSMLFLETYTIFFSTFSFPLGNTSPLHNFIKLYKLSKIHTRRRKSQKKPKIPIFIQVTQKNPKFIRTRSIGNQSRLPASEGGVPVCAVRAVPATLGKVFLQTLEVASLSTPC